MKGKPGIWELPASKLAEYRETFGDSLDVEAELRKARQWCLDNPPKRKTKSGIVKFLTGWLSRANDRGRQPVDTAKQQAEQRQRQIAAEASRREAEQARRNAAARPSEFARSMPLQRAGPSGVHDEDAARDEFNRKLMGVANGNA